MKLAHWSVCAATRRAVILRAAWPLVLALLPPCSRWGAKSVSMNGLWRLQLSTTVSAHMRRPSSNVSATKSLLHPSRPDLSDGHLPIPLPPPHIISSLADSKRSITSGIGPPASTCRNAVIICSSEYLLFFILSLLVGWLQARLFSQFSLVQFSGRTSPPILPRKNMKSNALQYKVGAGILIREDGPQ